MIDEIIKQLKPLINGKLIYLSQYGSHLYGLNTENSDLDFRGIYIPALDDIILHKDKDEINTELEVYLSINDITPTNIMDIKVDNIEQRLKRISKWDATNTLLDGVSIKKKVDVKIFSLQKFIQLCSKADTNALDLLFSFQSGKVEKYIEGWRKERDWENYYDENIVIQNIFCYKDRLINTDRLESPITYAFKQATKYSLKGDYLNLYDELLSITKDFTEDMTVLNLIQYIDKNGLDYLREKNNDGFWTQQLCPVTRDTKEKGGIQTYLNVVGVEHQANLPIRTFEERIKSKIKQYSKRAIDAKDGGNDWKALSHAIRVLLEIKELLDTGNIQFPLKDKDFLLDIKLGKVEREYIDNFFNQELSNILERVQKNELNWKYNEEFWSEFILSVYK